MIFQFDILFRFWFLVILTVLSIVCALFVLYHLLSDRTQRQALHNHVIILLLLIVLIMEIFDVPFVLHFIRVGYTWQLTTSLSYFWTFIDYGCYSTKMILFSWATIERHILIFHDRWLVTEKKRFLLHYLPMIIILLYCFIYYLIVVIFLPCPYPNNQHPLHGVPAPCLYDNVFVITWDLICHQIIPTIIIVTFSIALLVRVLYQKASLRRKIQWRKQRKMTIQLLSIAVLYQLFNFPWTFIQLCLMVKLPVDIDGEAFAIAFFAPYYLISFFPFVCWGTLPELGTKLKRLYVCRRPPPRVIHPIAPSLNH